MKRFLLLFTIILFYGQSIQAQVPANDLIQNAALLNKAPFNDYNLRLDLATTNNVQPQSCATGTFQKVYYKFTADVSGLLTIDVKDATYYNDNSGQIFAIVYTAPNLNVTSETDLSVYSDCVFGSATAVNVVQGQSYYILVHRINGNSNLTNIKITIPLAVPVQERAALVDFYNATNGANWNNNTNWNTASLVSSWYGLTVEKVAGVSHVTSINLDNNNVYPSIPASIEDLSELKNFYIINNFNYFSPGGVLPPEIGNLPKLTSFWIENWNLQGSLPTQIGNLSALESLTIRGTSCTGNIPATLTNLNAINAISLNNNKFQGALPDLTSLVAQLDFLRIENNHFEFGDLESNFSTYQSNIAVYTYAPQESLNFTNTDVVLNAGDNYVLNANAISGTNNQYQWYFNGQPLTGENNASMQLNNFQLANSGEYYCLVTNPIVTNLEINSAAYNIGITPTSNPDYNALVALYNATNGANWTSNNNWLDNTKPLNTWFGINTVNDRVEKIILNSNNLDGNIPTEITNLTELKELWLQTSPLLTGALPANIGDLVNLEKLILSSNSLSGQVPTSIQNLSQLNTLVFWNNNMVGELPDLSGLPLLTTMYLTGNKFQFGDFENSYAAYQANANLVFGYTPQQNLSVDETQFISIGDTVTLNANCSGANNLYQWYFNGQPLTGENNASLVLNNIQSNQFGNYYCLVTNSLVINSSMLTGVTTLDQDPVTHPDYTALVDFYNETSGATLWTNNTNWLDVNQPIANWYGVTEVNGRVTEINLPDNNIVATNGFPLSLTNLSELTRLDIWNNPIYSAPTTLPVELQNLSNLNYLDLRGWQLSGTIPSELGNLSNLIWIDLRNNQLSGNIPQELTNLSNLQVLLFTNNRLSGSIPNFSSITSLNYLWYEYNNFEFGDIETNFISNQNITSHVYVPQSYIDTAQSIAVAIGNATALTANTSGTQNNYQWYKDGVILNGATNTTLNVTINSSADYGIYTYQVTSNIVTNLTLQSKSFTVGEAPSNNSDYAALVALYNSTNGDNWTTNTNWLDDTKPLNTWYGVTLTNNRVTSISLGSNNLTGVLPTEIGDFSELQYLWLYSNEITGTIPPEIGNLTNLIELDLAPNTFSGTIPTEIGNLTNLEVLWLNQNGLTGNIPQSFQNLTNLRHLYLIGAAGPPYSSSAYSGDFPDLTALPLETLQMHNNYFTFADIADEFASYESTINDFSFSP
ncbi:MAG: leucine-rich repeat domain-containing protein, partial [Oceanihabitans sp.]